MKTVDASPSPRSHIAMLSKIGYEFTSAVGDIVDNSISAKASLIEISFLNSAKGPYLEIVDDGAGMDEDELVRNMAIGCRDPNEDRAFGDLGRFGAGLKTASFSQARRLSVITKKAKHKVTGATWDLGYVQRVDRWALQTYSLDELDCPQLVKTFEDKSCGTVVRWDELTNLAEGDHDADLENQKAELCAELHRYIGLYFHRFISGKSGVKFLINGALVQPIDPFMREVAGFEEGPSTSLRSRKGRIEIKAYQLPHISNMTSQEIDAHGGRGAIRQGQGLYVYREKRLIVAGGWMGLKQIENLSDLARIQIDIPASLDHEWVTDVKKSSLQIPRKVRSKLKGLLNSPIRKSRKAYNFRGNLDEASALWNIRDGARDDTISYEIDFENEKLESVLEGLDVQKQRLLLDYLSSVSADLPLNHIYSRMSDAPTKIDQSRLAGEEYLNSLYEVFANG